MMVPHYFTLFENKVLKNWEKPALSEISPYNESVKLCYTYGELFSHIKWIDSYLRKIGVNKGDLIVLCGNSSANWSVAFWAIAAYQGVAVTILPNQSIEDITALLKLIDSNVLFVDKNIYDSIQINEISSYTTIISLENFSPLVGQVLPILDLWRKEDGVCLNKGQDEDLSLICFTSGSTKLPKGVMIPLRSINSNIYLAHEDFPPYEGRNALSLLPFAHVYGLLIDVILPLCMGMHSYIFSEPPSQTTILKWYQCLKPASTMLVPLVLEQTISRLGNANYSIQEMREYIINMLGGETMLVGVGGATISDKLDAVINYKGGPFAICYGMTECGARVALKLNGGWHKGSVGRIVDGMEAKIVDGEIWVRGANVMLGYYKDEEATREKIDKDGWLHTGDAGYIDEDGYLFVKGRLNQDMIVLPNGENISPLHIEGLLNQVEGVNESLVLAREGQLVALVYAGVPLDRKDLLRTINPQLPLYSQLYDIEFVSEPFAKTPKQTIKRYLYF